MTSGSRESAFCELEIVLLEKRVGVVLYRVEDQHSGVLRHQPKTAELVGIKNSSIRSKRVGVSRKSE